MKLEETRPFGITILALLIGWLSIAGFGNALAIFFGDVNKVFGDLWFVYGLLAVAYGVFAVLACVSLWYMSVQATVALRLWGITCLLMIIIFSIQFQEFVLGGYIGALGFLIFTSLIFIGVGKYVRSKIHPVS